MTKERSVLIGLLISLCLIRLLSLPDSQVVRLSHHLFVLKTYCAIETQQLLIGRLLHTRHVTNYRHRPKFSSISEEI